MPIAKYEDKQVVRCGGKEATPYLRKNVDLFRNCDWVLDLGCGEGRNSRFLRDEGVETFPLDQCPDYGHKWLADEVLPLADEMVDGVLINYLLMFLTDKELRNVAEEVTRVTKDDSVMMVELEAVKSSNTPTMESVTNLKCKFLNMLQEFGNWKVEKETQSRFIARKF